MVSFKKSDSHSFENQPCSPHLELYRNWSDVYELARKDYYY